MYCWQSFFYLEKFIDYILDGQTRVCAQTATNSQQSIIKKTLQTPYQESRNQRNRFCIYDYLTGRSNADDRLKKRKDGRGDQR